MARPFTVLSISGTAVIPEFYSYSFDSLGKCKVTTTHYGTSNSSRWVKVYTDGFGHTVKTIVPAFGGTSSITSNIFNSKGQLVSTTVTGRPSASFAYDSMGNRISQVISGGTVTRHQNEQTNFVSSAGAVWQVAVQSTFGSDTVSGTSTTPLVVSQATKLSMLSNAEESKKIQIDARGNSAVTIQSFDTATKTHTTSQILPGITNIASTVTRDGLQLYSVNLNGGTMSLGYDALHRQITQTDPRGNVTSQVYNSYNQVVSVIDATGAVTSNDYDNAGRVSRITNALGGTVSFTYNPRNQKLSESGNATYPVSYGYNQFGEMTSLATYRVAGTPDITSFTFDPATGLLASKTYANGSSTVFSYDVAGKLTTKTLARTNSAGNNISISMQYDAFNQLVSKSYENDEVIFSGTTYTTPPVAFTYDLMGRLTKVVDAGGTQTRIYNQYSELTTETYAVLGATVTYLHDSLGRHAGIIGTSGGSTFYETSQTYDAATGQINSATFASSATFAFSYVPGTNLESSIVTPTYVKTMTYETNRNLPTEIKYNSNGVGTELIAKRNYTFDALGRVSSRTWQNSTINRNDTFCYNPRSELTNAMLGDQTYTYAFDTIGNRSSTTITGDDDPTIYSTNNLNQYTGIAHDLESFQPSFDADGNQTSYQANTSSTKISGAVDYNAENQICLIRNNTENGRFTCFYDAFGRRISKNDWFWGSDTLITRYLYAGTQLLAEFKANPVTPNEFSLGQTYFWDPTQPIATRVLALRKDRSNYPLSYLTYDLTKNVCERISATGAVEDEFWYDPFGNLISYHNDLSIRFLFSSEYFDRETGLYSYLFRYYNSRIGNWMTRDPIGEEGGLNLYLMCGNSVVNVWDKWGFILYAIDGTLHSKEKEEEDKSIVQRFCELSIETAKYWGGPIFPITGLDASFIFREVKDEICSDYCADNSLKINIIGWSRGATIAMEIAEYLEDNGCCCNGKKVYPRINWLGLLDAVDMTVTWGWAHDITSNVDNATHLKKTESQLIFPTSSGNAENPQKTKLTEAYLFESTHGDVGGPTKKRNKKRNQAGLHWMVHQAQKSGVKMKDVPVNYIVIKEN